MPYGRVPTNLLKEIRHTYRCMYEHIYSVLPPYTIHIVWTSMSGSIHIRCNGHGTSRISQQSHINTYRTSNIVSLTTLSYIHILGIFAQVRQHLLKSVERPISKDVDKMESTLLTLGVENHSMSSAI